MLIKQYSANKHLEIKSKWTHYFQFSRTNERTVSFALAMRFKTKNTNCRHLRIAIEQFLIFFNFFSSPNMQPFHLTFSSS